MAASFNFLSTIIAIPFIGLLFALAAKDDEKTHGRNVFNVSVFAIMTNLLVIWRMFALLDVSVPGLQMVERYEWLENPKISIVLGMDVFSLLLISAVPAAVLLSSSFCAACCSNWFISEVIVFNCPFSPLRSLSNPCFSLVRLST